MEKMSLKESIKKANKKFNYKRTILSFILGPLVGGAFTCAAYGAEFIIYITTGNQIIMSVQEFKNAIVGLSLAIGATVPFIVTLVNFLDFYYDKKYGKANLKKYAEELSSEDTVINTSCLKASEIISVEKNEKVISASTKTSYSEDNTFIIPTPVGKIVVARQTYENLKDGEKTTFYRESPAILLPEEEATQVINDNPTLEQKVLSKKIKGRKNILS